jgi:iron(III) transport system substrate-binding protein
MNRYSSLTCVLLSCVSFGATAQELMRFPAKSQVPSGYPAGYAATITAAEREGKLVIYSTTDIDIASELIDDFQSLYPKIEVEYQDLNSGDLYNRFLSDVLSSPTSADVVWSSAMDLQFSLVDQGYAQAYRSPEIAGLPQWAVWKEQAFATTYEPVVIAYNKRLLAADEIPQSHADLARLLVEKSSRFRAKVVTYDIERSGLGFLLATQDEQAAENFWDLARALGNAGVRFQAATESMLKRIASGEDLIAYNVLGSYAYRDARKDPSIGYVYPKDYTLVVTRIMFIGKKAGNPNAAKLWVDYVLSRRGQTVLANRANLFSLRDDVDGEATAAALTRVLGDSLKPISLGPSLTAYLSDRSRRLGFLEQWQQSAARKK